MRRLLVVTNLPTPYRVPLFNRLAAMLPREGWELEVIFGSRTNARRKWTVDEASLGFRHRFLEARNLSIRSDRVLNTYGGIKGALKEAAPDAIVCTGFSRGTMTAAAYAKRAGIPWVIWSGAVQGSETSWLRGVQRRWLVARCPRFLAYGSAAADYLAGLGAPRERIHTAWNTVDTSRFLGLTPGASKAPPLRLLTVGYLEKGKRLDLLFRALASVRARGLELELEVVGDGPHRAVIEASARGLPVRFLGNQPYERMGARYAAAHAFVFPTEYDVWGLVLLEAMAAGLPAVSSIRAGATRDLVADGETGFAVDFEDTAAVAARIAALAADPEQARDMGLAARARIEDRFTLDHSVAGWVELLQTLPSQAENRAESETSSTLLS